MKLTLIIVLLLKCVFVLGQRPGTLKVRVNMANSNTTDTLYFSFQNPVNLLQPKYPLITGIKQGEFYVFDMEPTDTCGYFTVIKKRTFTDKGGGSGNLTSIVNPQFWRSGDSICMDIDYHETMAGLYNKLHVSGKGAERYNFLKQIDALKFSDTTAVSFPSDDFSKLFEHPNTNVIIQSLELLDANKKCFDPFSYNVLKANSSWINAKYVFYRISKCFNDLKTDKEKQDFLKFYDDHIRQYYDTDIPADALINSNYLLFIFHGYRTESILKIGKEDFDWIYQKIMKETNGILRDRLLALCFINLKKPKNLEFFIKKTQNLIKDVHSREQVNDFAKFTEGRSFDGYFLKDIYGNNIALDSLMKNKVVIIDFWTYGCGPCRQLFENAIQPNEQIFGNVGEILFISVCLDRKKDRWIKGIKEGFYTSIYSTQLTTGLQGDRHPLLFENKINGTPTILLINKQGKIAMYNTQNLYNKEGLKEAIISIK